MRTLLITTTEAKIEVTAVRKLVPNKMPGWQIETQPAGSLDQTPTIPDVTLVQLGDDTQPADLKAMIPRLVHIQAKAPKRSYVVFSYNAEVKTDVRAAQKQNNNLHLITKQINHDLPSFPNPDRVNVIFNQGSFELVTLLNHIRAKLDLPLQILDIQLPKQTPRPSPLDRVKDIVKSTEDLREANGNLSASSVASAFGLSINELAGWLGRSRQALSKTPTADSLQDQLAFFERVARLRAVIPKDGFQKWLRIANPELDDKTPLDLLTNGGRQIVADLVDDMLTGAPA